MQADFGDESLFVSGGSPEEPEGLPTNIGQFLEDKDSKGSTNLDSDDVFIDYSSTITIRWSGWQSYENVQCQNRFRNDTLYAESWRAFVNH